MNIESQKYSEGYRIITQFFKCIGLYNEFLEYQRDSSYLHRKFNVKTKDPIKEFGATSISLYLCSRLSIYQIVVIHYTMCLFIL